MENIQRGTLYTSSLTNVEGSLAPDFTDTDQPRPFRLTGDRLEIGDGKTWRRVLERMR